jgi:hypothetical protein
MVAVVVSGGTTVTQYRSPQCDPHRRYCSQCGSIPGTGYSSRSRMPAPGPRPQSRDHAPRRCRGGDCTGLRRGPQESEVPGALGLPYCMATVPSPNGCCGRLCHSTATEAT